MVDKLKADMQTGRNRVSESASADWMMNPDLVDKISLNSQPTLATPSLSLAEYSIPERSLHQERLAQCKIEFDQLCNQLKVKYSSKASFESYKMTVPPNWKFSGGLVAHLHEHKSAVTRMTSLKTGGSLFASTSTDGTVRLWDCNRLDGHQNINRSRQHYSANTPLNAVAACDAGQSLAVAGRDGALLVLRIDPNSSKMALQQARHLDSNSRIDRTVKEQDDGPVVEMQAMDQKAQSIIVYATLYGAIVGWDIRMPGCLIQNSI